MISVGIGCGFGEGGGVGGGWIWGGGLSCEGGRGVWGGGVGREHGDKVVQGGDEGGDAQGFRGVHVELEADFHRGEVEGKDGRECKLVASWLQGIRGLMMRHRRSTRCIISVQVKI